jgi:hypothetical protein
LGGSVNGPKKIRLNKIYAQKRGQPWQIIPLYAFSEHDLKLNISTCESKKRYCPATVALCELTYRRQPNDDDLNEAVLFVKQKKPDHKNDQAGPSSTR